MRPITHLVVHCAASPDGKPVSAETIDQWHAARGFQRKPEWLKRQAGHLKHIGYHFVVDVDGMVSAGRHVEEVGAHVNGSNAWSIGICLIGTRRFTPKQWEALRQLVDGLLNRFQAARVVGHRDFSPDKDGDGVIEPQEWSKECPGFEVAQWRAAGMRPDWNSTHVL